MTNPVANTEPTSARQNVRVWVIGASALVVVVVAVALLILLGDEPAPRENVAASPTPTESAPAPSAEPSESAAPAAGLAPGEVVVHSGDDGIELFDAPGDSEPSDHLARWTALGSPTTLLGFERETVGGDEWIQVELLGGPNHREAWVREADVTVSSTTARIDIYLDERELDLTVDGAVQVSNSVVIGAPESPTPLGVFWVTDPLDFTPNPSGVYGAFALGMNGWSETLETFNGGPPQLAIHGTNQPEMLGENVSNGCIRLPNDVVIEVAEIAAPGTPVVVHQSRTA